MKKFSLPIPGIIVIVVLVGIVALVVFLGQKQPKSYTVPIPPSQLMPLVSAKEARTTICNLKKEELFTQACQSKFDAVDKEDIEKITELFALIEKIKNDKSISDYDRLLLSQAVFAALPIGDNPISRLKDYLTGKITAYAQGQTMSEEEFKNLMKNDLQSMVDSLPKGDNAWVINVMVSKYQWKDGKAQPLYSHQYMEVFDPFPNNKDVKTQDINYHIQARVGSKASSQTVDSEMIGYSFTIQSWKSQEYTSKDGPVEEKFLVGRNNFSDSSYQGEPYLNNLLDTVKMPSTKRPTEATSVESKNITCEEWKRVAGSKDCREWVGHGVKKGIWCADTYEKLYSYTDTGIKLLIDSRPPDYTYSFDYEACIITKEDYERNK